MNIYEASAAGIPSKAVLATSVIVHVAALDLPTALTVVTKYLTSLGYNSIVIRSIIFVWPLDVGP